MATDALALLKRDHKKVRKQFEKFTSASSQATKTKERAVEKILELLTVHTFIENECLYPAVRSAAPELEDEILESYEEHHVADLLMAEIAALKPSDEAFDAKVTVLIENVDHHIDEEESGWFPKVQKVLSKKQLREIGEQMEQKREKAPKPPSSPSALKKVVGSLLPH